MTGEISGSFPRIFNWLDAPQARPVERIHLRALQGAQVLIVMLFLASEVQQLFRDVSTFPADRIANFAVAAAAVASFLVLRRGRFKASAILLVTTFTAVMCAAFIASGLAFQGPSVKYAVIPLVLAGMLLGSRSLWIVTGALCASFVISWARDLGLGPTPPPVPSPSPLTAGLAALAYTLLVAWLIDRVGSVMRQNYRDTLQRETQLRDAQRQLVRRTREVETLYRRLEKSYEETLQSLTTALDLRDQETLGHSARVVGYANLLGSQLGLEEQELRQLRWGAILHDIGKIAVPVSILRKQGPLSDEERATIRRHPDLGHRMLRRVSFLDAALEVVRHHHEYWDGTGYPAGLRGDEIHIAARVFSVVDAYDAMTSSRPYRHTDTPDDARRELCRGAGRQFDPAVVDAFLDISQSELNVVKADAEIAARDRMGIPFDEAASVS